MLRVAAAMALCWWAVACGGDGPAWRDDLAAALAAAGGNGRCVLVRIVDPDAPLAAEMTAKTLTAPAAVAAAAELECVSLRATEPAAVALAQRVVGVRCALASCVIDAAGRPVAVQVGFAGVGEWAAWLRRAEVAAPELERLRATLDERPEDGPARLRLSERLMDVGCEREARVELARLVGDRDRRVAARAGERLARIAVEAGDPVAARARLERAAASAEWGSEGERAEAALTAALVLSAERRANAARWLLEAALARWPQAAERDRMWLELGRDRAAAGERAAAAEAFAAVLREDGSSPLRFEARRSIEALVNGGTAGHDHVHAVGGDARSSDARAALAALPWSDPLLELVR